MVTLFAAALSFALLAQQPVSEPKPGEKPPTPESKPETKQDGQPEAKPQTEAKPQGKEPIRVQDLPPQQRLGIRVEVVRRQLPVIPVVVIVPDVRSYVVAIGMWSLERGRFPVLIDDGTFETREEIARFVRGFDAKKVVRWTAAEENRWPTEAKDEPTRRLLVEAALASAWGAEGPGRILERFEQVKHAPPGVIAASMDDPAWPAALALAAGRGEFIAWVRAPKFGGGSDPVSATMTLEQTDELSKEIEGACNASGLEWATLGDAVDAVTLCLNTPAKTGAPLDGSLKGSGPFVIAPGSPVATTDLIGRDTADRQKRWAWCGQIFGKESRAAYMAMCALFLQSDRAWFFDGYEAKPGFEAFSGAEAAELLKKSSKVMLDVLPRNTERDFRVRGAGAWVRANAGKEEKGISPGGLTAGFICVNSSGNSEDFNLGGGSMAFSPDVPINNVPSVVHFVHSFSAQYPGNRSNIAGRWLERGAYAYAGSVHEPFLGAFVSTPNFVRRMLAPAPFGVSARLDGFPAWRITVIGDPLITMGPPAPRVETGALPLEKTADINEVIGKQLKAGEFESAMANLCIAGRDGDAVRLARAILRDEPGKLTSAAALAVLPAAFRRNDAEALLILYSTCSGQQERHPVIKDYLWHALVPGTGSAALSVSQIDLLRDSVRQESVVRDAAELSQVIKKVSGEESAARYLQGLAMAQKDPNKKKRLEEMAGAMVPAGPGGGQGGGGRKPPGK